MDSAQHCLDQAAECRGLAQLAQSDAEAHALKNLSRAWAGLAGQIDRYSALMREQRGVVRSSESPRTGSALARKTDGPGPWAAGRVHPDEER